MCTLHIVYTEAKEHDGRKQLNYGHWAFPLDWVRAYFNASMIRVSRLLVICSRKKIYIYHSIKLELNMVYPLNISMAIFKLDILITVN